jgi:hypothetical protein
MTLMVWGSLAMLATTAFMVADSIPHRYLSSMCGLAILALGAGIMIGTQISAHDDVEKPK